MEAYHFIGIGGIGMSSLARLVMSQGHPVSGSDQKDSPMLAELSALGARVAVGHRAENLGDAGVVVVSAAIHEANPEIIAARSRGLRIISRAELLGDLMDRGIGIAITGTHGKTTTTGMVALMLERAGLDPTVSIGGEMKEFAGNAKDGRGPHFVAEACEAYGSFLQMRPRIAVITNIEPEHLDYYRDFAGVQEGFRGFCRNVPEDGLIIGCGDEAVVREILAGANRRTITYGLRPGSDLVATEVNADSWNPSFTVLRSGAPLGRIELSMPGMQSVANALAAVAVGLEIGLDFARIQEGLKAFRGVHRRMEVLGEASGVLIIDDYAHHPTEVRATLAAALQSLKRPIVAVFQPHLYSRTRDSFEEFARCFRLADRVILTEIYAAREEPIEGVSAEALARRIEEVGGAPRVEYIAPKEAIIPLLAKTTRTGDVVITLGAGDIYKVGQDLLQTLNNDPPEGDGLKAESRDVP